MNASTPSSHHAAGAQRSLGAATLALVVALASTAAFLPPMVEATVASIPRTVLLGTAIVAGLLLHWAFLGIAAKRMARSVVGWVALSLLLFPIGSVAALILLGFFGDDPDAAGAPAPASGT